VQLHRSFAARLGRSIEEHGNKVNEIIKGPPAIVAFPVKPTKSTDQRKIVAHMRGRIRTKTIPGWAVRADTNIIERSARQLKKLADEKGWKKVIIPRPGCGYGELNWVDVKSVIETILDDRFHIITFSE
jgi:hypothetical protein